jgi:hypothetical protein
MPDTRMTEPEHANFLAAKVVAGATAYLDGRHDATQLAVDADRLQSELLLTGTANEAQGILVPARLLVAAMMRVSRAHGDARLDRWQAVMGALVELVRHESHELRRTGVQRS